MKFETQSGENNKPTRICGLRIGQMSEFKRLPNLVIETPSFLLYTKGGSVAYLTREVLELVTELQSQAVQIPLANSAQCYNSMKHFKHEISSFVALRECLSYCSVQDPGEETKAGYNERNAVSIWTHTGRKLLTSDMYMDMIEAFRPDMYHVLCDGDTSVESSRKRALKAVDVTTKMFKECLERHLKSQALKDSVLLAVLEGGYDMEARQKVTQLISQQPQVQGFVIDGLHNNGTSVEQMTYETIEPVIRETLRHLPQEKLRVIHGGWRPDVVLQLVYAGIDVFDSSLVYMATVRGCALTFTYHVLQPTEHNGLSNGIVNGCDHTKEESKILESNPSELKSDERILEGGSQYDYEMNLNEKRYFADLTPLLDKCECLTCTKHTRAYIHHLLNTREMLASVLLMIHNLHHYQKFFKAIREHGKNGRLLRIGSPPS